MPAWRKSELVTDKFNYPLHMVEKLDGHLRELHRQSANRDDYTLDSANSLPEILAESTKPIFGKLVLQRLQVIFGQPHVESEFDSGPAPAGSAVNNYTKHRVVS